MVNQCLTTTLWLVLGVVACSATELTEAVAACNAEDDITTGGQQMIQMSHMKQRRPARILVEAPRKESGSDSGSDAESDSGANTDSGSDSGADSGVNTDSGSDSGSELGASLFYSAACDIGWAKEAPLTEAGFQSVAETCCFDDMSEYIQLVVTDIGLKVCDRGGLSGMSPFFSCPSQPSTFGDLQNALRAATPAGGNRCPWIEVDGQDCPTLASSCSVRINPTTQPTLFEGYLGLQAISNPAALVTTPEVEQSVHSKLAEAISVPAKAIVITMGTGPISEVSLLSLDKCSTCTVFASYSVVQTDPPTLDESVLAESMASMNASQLETAIATQISTTAPQVGTLRMTKLRSCKEGGICVEKMLRDDIKSDHPAVAKGTMGDDPFQPCKYAGPTPVACAVYMGEGISAKASQCALTGHSIYACKIGQNAPCKGMHSGDACIFENITGSCSNMSNIGQPVHVKNYCNIWPIAGAPATTKMPTTVTGQDMQVCVNQRLPLGAACKISMGEGALPKEGMCKLGDVGPCDVGQMLPMDDHSVGDVCTKFGHQGVVQEHHANLYCNIWPISKPTTTKKPRTTTEAP